MTIQNITKEEVKHVANLAKLECSEEELNKFTNQIEDIVNLVNSLNEVDTKGVEPTFSVTDQINRMREDIAVKSGQKDDLLANAPETEDGFIRVPAIIDESGEA